MVKAVVEMCIRDRPFFLILIKKNMVRHYNLRPVGNKDIRHGYVSVRNGMYFIDKYRNVQRNAVSDNARRMSVKNTGRKGVKRKFAIVIDNRVSCVRTCLLYTSVYQ